jgi:hypothetical protein
MRDEEVVGKTSEKRSNEVTMLRVGDVAVVRCGKGWKHRWIGDDFRFGVRRM